MRVSRRFGNRSIAASNTYVLAEPDQTVPYGVVLSQALRARLRSHRPPGHGHRMQFPGLQVDYEVSRNPGAVMQARADRSVDDDDEDMRRFSTLPR